ncbi:MAG TPA: tetratricopeptide repeat protein [Chitinophagaceae bacterium]|nr:tetratricopeptide repeat protein [Chitinophagaceae bacterium]
MRLLLAYIACLIVISLRAQDTKRLDSLLSKLSIAKADTNKVLLLLSVADEYEVTDLEKARPYIGQAMQLSRNLNYTQGIMKAYRHYAYIYSYQSKFDSSIYVNRIVLEMAKQKKDSFGIGVAYFNIGVSHRFKQDLDSALQYTLEGARLLDGKGYGNVEGVLNDGLQSLYMSMTQYDKAVQYGEKAVAIARKHQNMEHLATSLNNLGLNYVELNRLNDAKQVYAEGLEVTRKIGYQQVEAMLLNNLSDILLREGRFEEAGNNAFKVLQIQKRFPDSATLMSANTILAHYYLAKGDYDKAEQLAKMAMDIADKQSFDDGEIEALGTLARIAFAKKEFNKGLEYEFQRNKVEENVFNESVKQREAGWRARYETEQKDSQIKLQQAQLFRKDILNYILIGSVATIFIISLLGYINYRHRRRLQQQRINELETEKQLAATEAVLKGEEQERTRLAKDLHDGLGGMLSGIKYSLNTMKGNLIMTPGNAQTFERSIDMLDSSIAEMRRVAHNMMPEALVKFGLDTAFRDFCNDLNQSGALNVTYESIGTDDMTIEQTRAVTVYRIVQELLNNIIKHASAKSALVQLAYNNGQMVVTVEDDGKGFEPAILKQSKGIGWGNIQNRIEFLKGKWDVDSKQGQGTSVHLVIPE